MILPISWIKDYVTSLETSDVEYAKKMTLIGQKVERYFKESDSITKIVTAKVISVTKHPNADNLYVCAVDIGKAEISVVTAATNLKSNHIVPVALDGAMLANGSIISKGSIRDVESMGMFCSLAELGLTQADFPECDPEGIMILPADTEIGKNISEELNLDDTIFEFEITPNRPDCMSVVGLARETAAAYDLPFSLTKPTPREILPEITDYLKVERITDNCLRYTAAVMKNVTIKPSPAWMRERLRKCGLRPINNIVDITNYIMLEYGQPMHAFDHRHVSGNTIVIRQAKETENIVTLDGICHMLDDSMMVIADSEKPTALAGIMGSEYSGIYEDTSVVIFESANFDNLSVRFSAKKLGMRTDSSALFEKGLDPNTALIALQRAIDLTHQLGAGELVGGIIDEALVTPQPKKICLEHEVINRFLGTDLSVEFMISALQSFRFEVDDLMVLVPTFRADVEGMADLAEEIARYYGYDNIPSTIMSGVSVARLTETQYFERDIKQICLSAGLYETTTLSFMSNRSLDMICLADDDALRNAVKISNPFGEETSLMRTTLLPSLMEVLARNYNVRTKAACFFELAATYIPMLENELPDERKSLTIAGYGSIDYYSLKGLCDLILDSMKIEGYEYIPMTDNNSYHPGRAARIMLDGKEIAVVGELHPKLLDNYVMRTRCYAAQLDIDLIYELRGGLTQYEELPRYPAITRDLALVCDEAVLSSSIVAILKGTASEVVESIEVFDVFRGGSVEAGKKSIAYSITLRDREGTLTDRKADEIISAMLASLAKKDIQLRS
ncbi:MAG: phenylalanine--tRNA ligase subunit beta, partial [Oscillospiraceae bacterium]|nr:phenylalanine--tRNA ligase subunit beta [Oscillospiraceae bacterium]